MNLNEGFQRILQLYISYMLMNSPSEYLFLYACLKNCYGVWCLFRLFFCFCEGGGVKNYTFFN